MCRTCSIKLYSSFDFKSTCLYVEEKILAYVNPKVPFVDLRDVYFMKLGNRFLDKMEDDQKISRLCLQLVSEGFVPFQDMNFVTIRRYIPEVNFSITEDPIVCRKCFDSPGVHGTFIKICLDVEAKIHNIGDKIITGFKYSSMFSKTGNEIELGDGKMKEGFKIEKELETDETCTDQN
ncbi:uncharacterized protein LOC111691618 [Anoplophora glabripennis]|uniref:uncharacterized protein LOC111691618 n=1 Tax=Anoplophora glabripennis TaxID=217634 RepID=UPI000C78E1C9|nr:uncharacterized protein LOC111691618 [Anoplophora glabripennis]